MTLLKRTFLLILSVIFLLPVALCSCDKSEQVSETTEETEDNAVVYDSCTAEGVKYTDTAYTEAMFARWEKEDNLTNKAGDMDGVTVSPYYTLKVNGNDVPVYAARTATNAHSFAYIDVSDIKDDGSFELKLEIHNSRERTNPVVLPESRGVVAVCDGKDVTATITEYGSYTFTFDKDGKGNNGSLHPLTIMVKAKEVLNVPDGYNVEEIEPGEYNVKQLKLNNPKTVYYFKAGRYTFECIQFGDEVIAYFEPGVYLDAQNLTLNSKGETVVSSVFYAYGCHDVKIIGRPLVDMSHIQDGKGVLFNFEKVENFEISGLTAINSCGWTVCLTNCVNVDIHDIMIFAYKTYSDGVLLSDCKSCKVRGSFVRTGDDAMEVKSTSGGGVKTDDILFEDNAVWTDKGIGYGAVYESNHSQRNVTWRNCSVGYALANWSNHLGCMTISMRGDNEKVKDYDMHFENIEIYYSKCPVFTTVLEQGGDVEDIYFENITAKEVVLNEEVFTSYIDLICGNGESYTIKNLYFDNVSINGTVLTEENKTEIIGNSFASENVSFSYDTVFVNTQGK